MHEFFRFTTEPRTCPYLHDRPSRLEVRLVASLSSKEYADLLARGWRRFGRAVFRPRCWNCEECVALRVPVAEFRPTKTQRRVLRRNLDVRLEVGEPTFDRERLDLHRRFHTERSVSRGWPPSNIDLEEYVGTFVDNACNTLEFRYRIGDRLVAVAYVGEARDALNSIYAFYDPDLSRRSLGTYDILVEIQEAHRAQKHFLYLGYYVTGCPSMAYKRSFRPHQLLGQIGTENWRCPEPEAKAVVPAIPPRSSPEGS